MNTILTLCPFVLTVAMGVIVGTVLLGRTTPSQGKRWCWRVLWLYTVYTVVLIVIGLWTGSWFKVTEGSVFFGLVLLLRWFARKMDARLALLDRSFVDAGAVTIVTLFNGEKLYTHPPGECEDDEFCCIHRPSNHPLNTAPYVWRDDHRLMERLCEHGIGHPDPDGLAHMRRAGRDPEGGFGIHACDGCCHKVASRSTDVQGELGDS